MKHAWELHQVGGDVVYGSSPETFDPSIVELFAALGKSGKFLLWLICNLSFLVLANPL